MDRRQALRNIGWGAGALVATPTIISILQSCENKPTFVPVFLNPAQGHALKTMVDLIIPDDEAVPGAVAVGVHEFIDRYWKDVLAEDKSDIEDEFTTASPTQEQKFVTDAFSTFENRFKSTFEKELADGTPEEFDQMLEKYLKSPKSVQLEYGKKMGDYLEMLTKNDNAAKFDEDAQVYYLLSSIRGLTMWGWKTSEQIGENVLWYDPVPGQYLGCIPIEDAGNGKDMSL